MNCAWKYFLPNTCGGSPERNAMGLLLGKLQGGITIVMAFRTFSGTSKFAVSRVCHFSNTKSWIYSCISVYFGVPCLA